eukprot:scaffold12153_cov167-Amphora_coffeaeformis.AAC.3
MLENKFLDDVGDVVAVGFDCGTVVVAVVVLLLPAAVSLLDRDRVFAAWVCRTARRRANSSCVDNKHTGHCHPHRPFPFWQLATRYVANAVRATKNNLAIPPSCRARQRFPRKPSKRLGVAHQSTESPVRYTKRDNRPPAESGIPRTWRVPPPWPRWSGRVRFPYRRVCVVIPTHRPPPWPLATRHPYFGYPIPRHATVRWFPVKEAGLGIVHDNDRLS